MSRHVSVTIPHKLGKAEARRRVEGGLGRFKDEMGQAGLGQIQHAWADDRLAFTARSMGQSITGRIEVRDADLRIEVDLPAFLAAFADKIAAKLRKEGTHLIEKK